MLCTQERCLSFLKIHKGDMCPKSNIISEQHIEIVKFHAKMNTNISINI